MIFREKVWEYQKKIVSLQLLLKDIDYAQEQSYKDIINSCKSLPAHNDVWTDGRGVL